MALRLAWRPASGFIRAAPGSFLFMKTSLLLPLLGLLALAGCGGPAGQSAPATTTSTTADGLTITTDNVDADSLSTAPLGYAGNPERQVRPGTRDTVTVYPTIMPFRVRDQDGHLLTNRSLAGRVYVTDFFFATCPGICPKMQSELLKVYKRYATDPAVVFVSHTIDPEHDTQPVLRDYARRLGAAEGGNWRFARTSVRDSAYALANAYFVAARPDAAAPGGIAHSGIFALVDDQGHVRGLYDSLTPGQTAKLLRELPRLLAEVKARR